MVFLLLHQEVTSLPPAQAALPSNSCLLVRRLLISAALNDG